MGSMAYINSGTYIRQAATPKLIYILQVVWRNLVSVSGTLPNDPTPGTIDSTDYDYWRSHFGATSGAGSASVASAVPEPASVVLFAMGLVGATCFCRRRKNAP